ncbi:Flavin-dependent monooxygenase, reductase subunit HsaB [archaeon HR01]|nr:Flavin-dependent monooxygenase, reductase subunit HsaB [archaeon HR01]
MDCLRDFMRRTPQCVTVVATYVDGVPHGMTVSSFTSVSLEPPLVVVALQRDTRTCQAILQSGRFSVNLLGEGQEAVSDIFAYAEHSRRFSQVGYTVKDGVYPVLDGVVAALFCRTVDIYGVGDHKLIVGEVAGCEIYSDELPLIYLQRRYYGVGAPKS